MADDYYYRPAIPLVIALMTGIACGAVFPGIKSAAWILLALLGFLLILAIRQGRSLVCVPLLFSLILGYLSIQSWLAPDLAGRHISRFMNAHYHICGIVVKTPQAYRYGQRFELQTVSLGAPDGDLATTGRIRVTVPDGSPDIDRGERICFRGRIRPLHNFNNPGGFDYRRYMRYRRIWGSTYVSVDDIHRFKTHGTHPLHTLVDTFRYRIGGLIDAVVSKPAVGAVLKTLLMGDRSSLGEEWRDRFSQVGIAHLLAISGLHVGVVAGVAFAFLRMLLGRVKFCLWNAWVKKTAALLTLVPVWLYALVAGASPATQRAAIMVSVYLLTFLFEREHDGFNTLALAALFILTVDPPALCSVSFQLSFAAVTAIIYGWTKISRPVSQPPLGWRKRAGRMIGGFWWVSLLALAGTLPLVMYYFNRISVLGPFANFLFVPLLGMIAVPLGLTAICLYPLSTWAAQLMMQADAHVVSLALVLVEQVSLLPLADVHTVSPTVVEIGLYYMFGWAVFNLRSPAKSRPRALVPWVLSLLLAAGAVDAVYWLHQRYWHRDLRVSVLDVGPGSAALLELPGGYTLMLDGGGFGGRNAFDVGRRVVAPYLWRRKIQTLNTVVLSHADSDHLCGLLFLLRHYKIGRVWFNGEAADSEAYRRFCEILESQEIAVPVFETLPRRWHINGVELAILYPPSDFIQRGPSERWRNRNNNSLVLRAELGQISFLFPGDIHARAEADLIQRHAQDLASTVLIAPHHGSRTSSSRQFVLSVDPQEVVVSCGRRRSSVPHPDVLKRYREQGARVWRTDMHGAVILATSGVDVRSKVVVRKRR